MALVITSCTNRKRRPVSPGLHMADLSAAPIEDLASDWGERLSKAPLRYSASEVYGGRNFQEARAAAVKLHARLVVVSAGLGLIDASTSIPAYGCTILVGARDSVQQRVSGEFSVASWWRALAGASTFSVSLKDVVRQESGPLLVALSEAYLEMLAPELMALSPPDLERVRIFTGSPIERTPPALRAFRMPYDHRLDGPDSSVPGTRSDFASRALSHFAGLGRGGASEASVAEDADAVRSAIKSWRAPPKFERKRLDDQEVLVLIEQHWDRAGGSSTRLLRLFRDELAIACEQSRFAALARQVRESRK